MKREKYNERTEEKKNTGKNNFSFADKVKRKNKKIR